MPSINSDIRVDGIVLGGGSKWGSNHSNRAPKYVIPSQKSRNPTNPAAEYRYRVVGFTGYDFPIFSSAF